MTRTDVRPASRSPTVALPSIRALGLLPGLLNSSRLEAASVSASTPAPAPPSLPRTHSTFVETRSHDVNGDRSRADAEVTYFWNEDPPPRAPGRCHRSWNTLVWLRDQFWAALTNELGGRSPDDATLEELYALFFQKDAKQQTFRAPKKEAPLLSLASQTMLDSVDMVLTPPPSPSISHLGSAPTSDPSASPEHKEKESERRTRHGGFGESGDLQNGGFVRSMTPNVLSLYLRMQEENLKKRKKSLGKELTHSLQSQRKQKRKPPGKDDVWLHMNLQLIACGYLALRERREREQLMALRDRSTADEWSAVRVNELEIAKYNIERELRQVRQQVENFEHRCRQAEDDLHSERRRMSNLEQRCITAEKQCLRFVQQVDRLIGKNPCLSRSPDAYDNTVGEQGVLKRAMDLENEDDRRDHHSLMSENPAKYARRQLPLSNKQSQEVCATNHHNH